MYFKYRQVHLCQPRSFFDIDDLHRILPVEEDRREIIRDGAEVDIVGEHEPCMRFCFMIRLYGRIMYIKIIFHHDSIV